MRNKIIVLLILSIAAIQNLAVAATRCPALFVNGREPSLNSQLTNRTNEVCYTEYVLLASGVTKGPLYSAEHLTKKQIDGANSITRVGSWHSEQSIPVEDRSYTDDYTNSGYDRGHMTPAGDPSTEASEKETFSMANVVPQNPTLNRGKWEKIENNVRNLAAQLGEIFVVTGPAFNNGAVPTIGPDAVYVPSYTWKAIYEPGVGAGVYLCRNDSAQACQVISVADVQALTGIDPFPSLSSAVKSSAIPLQLP
ncbi:DNA/RNA non-specific endonuclease [Burkholderia mayonis]|uniref:DNA/RNA non-specific endonuclease n=1 Tax=Burkholderia mayonis TaxID=1385591 RepID=UPI0009E8458D|nr:DNA/RNA non-specific endonuclease [Burkholderia mayonis]